MTEGFTVQYNLANDDILSFNVPIKFIFRDEESAYQRVNGHIKGGIVCQETY